MLLREIWSTNHTIHVGGYLRSLALKVRSLGLYVAWGVLVVMVLMGTGCGLGVTGWVFGDLLSKTFGCILL